MLMVSGDIPKGAAMANYILRHTWTIFRDRHNTQFFSKSIPICDTSDKE